MNECVETKKCRAAPDLPEKFRELGVPENVAIFFEVAGKAPQDLLNTIRGHSFYKNSIHFYKVLLNKILKGAYPKISLTCKFNF